MAFEAGFDYRDLSEFAQEMTEAVEMMPIVAKRFMRAEAKALTKYMKQKARNEVGVVTGNYLNGFKPGRKVYDWSDAEFNIRVFNDMPHAHLIEYGHRKFDFHGQDTGKVVPGKHIIENAAITYEKKFTENIEKKLVKKVLEELEK